MKRILFVFNHPAFYKVRLLNELSKYFEIDVIFERRKNKDRNKFFYSESNYKFNLIPINGIKLGNENFLSFGIKKYLKNNHAKYDYIIMNGYSTMAEMIAINYLHKKKIPYYFYINGGIINFNESRFRKNLKTKFISGASLYFSPDENSNKYLEYYGVDKNKIKNYIYSTIYKDEIASSLPSEKEIKEHKKKYNLVDEKLYISTGQLIKRKNYLNLIKSWPKDKNKVLLIFGEGKQEKKIRKYLQKNNIQNIILGGYKSRDYILNEYRFAYGFIFSSNKDIYGHVINEALSQGLNVISTKKVNASIKLINDKNGYLIDEINEDNLSVALSKIEKLNKKDALKTAKENTIELMVKSHLKILR